MKRESGHQQKLNLTFTSGHSFCMANIRAKIKKILLMFLRRGCRRIYLASGKNARKSHAVFFLLFRVHTEDQSKRIGKFDTSAIWLRNKKACANDNHLYYSNFILQILQPIKRYFFLNIGHSLHFHMQKENHPPIMMSIPMRAREGGERKRGRDAIINTFIAHHDSCRCQKKKGKRKNRVHKIGRITSKQTVDELFTTAYNPHHKQLYLILPLYFAEWASEREPLSMSAVFVIFGFYCKLDFWSPSCVTRVMASFDIMLTFF